MEGRPTKGFAELVSDCALYCKCPQPLTDHSDQSVNKTSVIALHTYTQAAEWALSVRWETLGLSRAITVISVSHSCTYRAKSWSDLLSFCLSRYRSIHLECGCSKGTQWENKEDLYCRWGCSFYLKNNGDTLINLTLSDTLLCVYVCECNLWSLYLCLLFCLWLSTICLNQSRCWWKCMLHPVATLIQSMKCLSYIPCSLSSKPLRNMHDHSSQLKKTWESYNYFKLGLRRTIVIGFYTHTEHIKAANPHFWAAGTSKYLLLSLAKSWSWYQNDYFNFPT